MPRTAATVFSLDLKINGNSVTVPTGNFKFSRAVSGFGESGISTGQFEFDLYDEFGDYGEALLAGASARLYEANGAFLPSMEYYISKRSVDNRICHFVAYDIMSKTDMPFDDSGLAFFFENGYETLDCDTVMNAVKSQCEFDSIGYSDSFGTEDINFTQDQLQDTTCRQLMETVAAAMCGCWTAFGDNGKSVRLNCFGASPAATTEVACYAEINMQGKQKITRLIVTDSESGDSYPVYYIFSQNKNALYFYTTSTSGGVNYRPAENGTYCLRITPKKKLPSYTSMRRKAILSYMNPRL